MRRAEPRPPGGRAAQAARDDGLAAPERLVIAGAAAQQAFQRDERQREREEHCRELQRRGLVERAVPDAIDRVGERAIAEQVDGAESASASITASATPAASAGRASGRATRRSAAL